MFGMGFLEIFLILIVAIIALGPEKLPSAAVDIAKMIKKLKGSIDDAKSSLDSELNLSSMKSEAEKFKDSIGVDRLASLSMNDMIDYDDDINTKKVQKKANKENSKDKIINASYVDKTNNEVAVQNNNEENKEKEEKKA